LRRCSRPRKGSGTAMRAIANSPRCCRLAAMSVEPAVCFLAARIGRPLCGSWIHRVASGSGCLSTTAALRAWSFSTSTEPSSLQCRKRADNRVASSASGARRCTADFDSAAAPSDNHFRMRHILIVDDDALMLGLIAKALDGYRLTLARDGAEALAAADRNGALDLIITDYLMP